MFTNCIRGRIIITGLILSIAHTAVAQDFELWNPQSTGHQINDLWVAPNGEAFAVADHGTIVHFDGTAWSRINSGTTESLEAIWGRTATDVFAVGLNSTALHYDGTGWTSIGPLAEPSQLRGVCGGE